MGVTTKGVTVSAIASILNRDNRTIRYWMNGEAVLNSKGAYVLPECAIQIFFENNKQKIELGIEEEHLRAVLEEHEIHEDSKYHLLYLQEKEQRDLWESKADAIEQDRLLLLDDSEAIREKLSIVKSQLKQSESRRKEAESQFQSAENGRKLAESEKNEISAKLHQSESRRKEAESQFQSAENGRKLAESEKKEISAKLQSVETGGNLKKWGRSFSTFTQSLVFLYGFMFLLLIAETFAHESVTVKIFSTNVVHAFLAAGLFQVAGFVIYTSNSLKAAFKWDKSQVLNAVTGYNFLMNLAALFLGFDWSMSAEMIGGVFIRVLVALGFAIVLKVIGTIIIQKQKELA